MKKVRPTKIENREAKNYMFFVADYENICVFQLQLILIPEARLEFIFIIDIGG